MKIIKKQLDVMERCYSASHISVNGEEKVLLASEAIDGPCFCYGGPDFTVKEPVWQQGGGTMSMVELPWRKGDFLATQRFFPGFQSAESKVVLCRYQQGKWTQEDFLSLPYLHRFDVLKGGDQYYFIGCTLCGSKKDREDWSDPGKLWVDIMSTDLSANMALQPLVEGLYKNHGYWRGFWEGKEAAYVTCEKGIYVAVPPQTPTQDWTVQLIFKGPVSDVAAYDLDGDGVDELAVISPFHGHEFSILKKGPDGYGVVYRYPGEIDFAHALWAGKLAGKPAALCGIRRVNCELFYVIYNASTNTYQATVIDQGVGTANVAVLHQKDRDVIISANHTKNEAAVYFATE